MTHTPEPWTYDPQSARIHGPPHDHPQDRKLGIKTAPSCPIVAYVKGHHGKEEQDANGRILGASLKMLKALEVVTHALGLVDDYGTATGENPDIQNRALDQAQAAIAEARGQS